MNNTTDAAGDDPCNTFICHYRTDPHSDFDIISFVLGVVCIIVLCWCSKTRIVADSPFGEAMRIRSSLRNNNSNRQSASNSQDATQQDPDKRAARINSSLLCKQVLTRDEDGNLTVGDVDCECGNARNEHDEENPADTASVLSSSCGCNEEDDGLTNACPICLEEFAVGDVVAWSRNNTACSHVFHKDCIQLWLVDPTHESCPSCRSMLLQPDEGDDMEANKKIPPLDTENAGASESQPLSSNNIFVIIHGLVSRMTKVETANMDTLSPPHLGDQYAATISHQLTSDSSLPDEVAADDDDAFDL